MIPAWPGARLTRGDLEIQKQVVTFELPLLGTPYSLHYRSDHVPGRVAPSPLRIPIGPKKPAPRLKEVVLEIDAPGQQVRKTFDPSTRFYRHELEAQKGTLAGKTAVVRIGYRYRARFPRPELTQWRDYIFPLHPWDARTLGLGGWTLNVQHRYDASEKVVRLGDGRRQSVGPGDMVTRDGQVEVVIAGRDQVLVFDSGGRHLRTLDAVSRAVAMEFAFTAAGELLSLRDVQGQETFVRRLSGREIRIGGAGGDEIRLHVDDHGFLAEVITAAGRDYRISHSADGLLAMVEAPGKRRHAYRYDDGGRVIAFHEPGAPASQVIARTDGNRQTVAVIDAEGRELLSERELRENGEILQRSRCCGGAEIRSVRRRDGSEEVVYPAGYTVTVRKDGVRGTVERSLAVSGRTIASTLSRTVDPSGRRDFVEVNGRRYETRTDAATRRTTFTTAEGRSTTFDLDEHGAVKRVVGGNGSATEYRRDARGRIIEIARKAGREERSWKLAYDERGRLTEVRDPLGRSVRASFDKDDFLVQLSDPDGEVAYVYSAAGLLEALERGGRRLAIGPPLPLNEPAQSSFTFDPRSGLVSRLCSADGIEIDVAREGPFIAGITYSGRVSGTVQRELGADLTLAADRVNGGVRVEYQFDRDALLVRAGRISFERDRATGRVIRRHIGRVEIISGYGDFGELRELRCLHAGRELYALAQTHDALGRVVQRSERIDGNSHAREYAYDVAGRLSAVTSEGSPLIRFSYDANGNRLNDGARYDAGDLILEMAARGFEHDGQGARTAAERAGGRFRYRYDANGPLRAVVLPDGRTISYLLDAVARPCQTLLDGRPIATHVHDHRHRLLAVVDASGIVTRFIYGTKFNVPEYLEREGRAFLVLSDTIGSARLTVDIESGEIAHRRDFDEWGNITLEAGTPLHPFGFAGGIHDPFTGLTRFGVRYYDPPTGRWTQPDPLGYLAGTNLYEYAAGDPVNRVDPLGLETTGTSGGMSGGGGGFIFEMPDQEFPVVGTPQWVPPEAGTPPVDRMNPRTEPLDFRKLFGPPRPGLPDRRGPYANPNPTQWDFGWGPIRCFVTTPHGRGYRTDDTGGIGRNPDTGRGLYGPENAPGTTTADFGIRF